MIRLTVVFLSILLIAGCSKQEPGDQTAEHIRESRLATNAAFLALDQGNPAGFLEEMKRATTLRPGHPTIEYHLGRAYLMNGDTLSALQTFERVARMGVFITFDDPVLMGLRTTSVGRDVEQRLQRNNIPKVASSVVFVGTDPNFQSEGITRFEGKWLMASVHQNRIAWGDGPTWTDTRPRSAMGMKKHGSSLWVATTGSQEGGAQPEDIGSTQLVQIDLRSGKVLSTISPTDKLDHWFGDVEIDPSGLVYVSDSFAPGVFKVQDNQLLPVVVGDPFTSPQGMAYLNDRLYVADYSAGIFQVDVKTGATQLLSGGDGETLLGIDGMLAFDGGLVAIQNGMVPPRVLFIELLTPSEMGSVVTLESNHPDYSDPTVGYIENDTLFYMANSQWPLFSPSADSTLRKPSVILGLPLRFNE